jgi:hypothetical protein
VITDWGFVPAPGSLIITTLLTAIFSWLVSALPVSTGVCLMGGSTVIGGFYALFFNLFLLISA